MLKQALLAFGTDPHRAIPPIQRFRRLLAFLHAYGRQHRNHRLWSDGNNHGTLFGTKSDIFTQPKVYDAKTKSLMCQNGLFSICLSLVHDVLDTSKSTSTYCLSHLFTNSGNLVAHLVIKYRPQFYLTYLKKQNDKTVATSKIDPINKQSTCWNALYRWLSHI